MPKKPKCRHHAISMVKGYPICLDCRREFKNGELGKIRKAEKDACDHSEIEYGYASNPPKAKCLKCCNFFSYEEAQLIQQKKEGGLNG